MERYRFHVKRTFEVTHEELAYQEIAAKAIARQMDVLIRSYDSIGDPKAKRAVRASVISSEEMLRKVIEKLEFSSQQQIFNQTASFQAAGCQFLERESHLAELSEPEKQILAQKVKECSEFVVLNLKDYLEEKNE